MDEEERFDFLVSLVLVFFVSVWCLVPGLLTMVLTSAVYGTYIFATSRVGMLLIAAAAGYYFALSGRAKPVDAKKNE